MPYKEIGTPVDFSSWSIVSAGEVLVAGVAGIYGYQSVAGSTSINIDTIDLYAVKSSLEASGKVTINYMRMSWNQSGTTITDFVFGFVCTLKAPISMNALWGFIPWQLQTVVTDLQMVARNDFTVYLLGLKQGDYTYTWSWEALSGEYLILEGQQPPSDSEIHDALVTSGKVDEALNGFKSKALEGGVTITVRGYTIVETHAEYVRTITSTVGFDKYVYHTRVKLNVDFDSDTPITASPIAPLIILAIAIAIIIIAGGIYFALINLTTSSSTVTTRITNPTNSAVTIHTPQGDVTIPPGGTYTYTESATGPPAMWGWVIPIVVLIVVAAGALVVVPRLLPERRREYYPPPPPIA